MIRKIATYRLGASLFSSVGSYQQPHLVEDNHLHGTSEEMNINIIFYFLFSLVLKCKQDISQVQEGKHHDTNQMSQFSGPMLCDSSSCHQHPVPPPTQENHVACWNDW